MVFYIYLQERRRKHFKGRSSYLVEGERVGAKREKQAAGREGGTLSIPSGKRRSGNQKSRSSNVMGDKPGECPKVSSA